MRATPGARAAPGPRSRSGASRAGSRSARPGRAPAPRPGPRAPRAPLGPGRSRREERRADVAVGRVRQDRDDPLPSHLRPRADLHRGPDRGTRRYPRADALAARAQAGGLDGVLVLNRDDFVDDVTVEDLGDEAG